ncbi:MAG: hypothetical protein KAS49_01095 [Candidatus Cloacimonetes bacterium]|nr:hypothetical protein [Candidatus Cloacimonadota bacterium]
MYMILQLNQDKYQDDVLMALTEAGIEDTVVMAAETLGHKLLFDNPLFAGFRKTMGSDKGYANVIMAIAEQDQIDFMIEELKNAGIDLIEDNIAKIILLPIAKIY